MLMSEKNRKSLSLLRKLAISGWREYPSLSAAKAEAAVQAFEGLIAYSEATPGWADRFNAAGASWKERCVRTGYENSGYFGPYYKNLIGQQDKDQKITYQTCPSFVEELRGTEYPDRLNQLDKALMNAAWEVVPYMHEMVEAVLAFLPDWRSQLFDKEGNPRISVRALKYSPDTLAGTNPHVDKSAFTCIMHTSDDVGQHRLVVCPPWGSINDLNDYVTTGDTAKTAVAFAGAALSSAGFDLLEAVPHAVLPLHSDQPRYSLVVFWLLQGVDMRQFDTTVFMERQSSILRRYAKKHLSSMDG